MLYDFNEYHRKVVENIAVCERIQGHKLNDHDATAVTLMVGRIYRYLLEVSR